MVKKSKVIEFLLHESRPIVLDLDGKKQRGIIILQRLVVREFGKTAYEILRRMFVHDVKKVSIDGKIYVFIPEKDINRLRKKLKYLEGKGR